LLVEQNAHMALGVANTGHVLEVGSLVHSGPARSWRPTTRSARRTSACTDFRVMPPA
jgi:ABC-type branched-subunit amino acid transport system ATPase component